MEGNNLVITFLPGGKKGRAIDGGHYELLSSFILKIR